MTTTRHVALFQCPTCGTVDDVEHIDREANRLTDDDRERIDAALRDTLAGYASQQPNRHYAPSWADVDTMLRIMHHAIGCTSHDLRVCELDEIRGKVAATVGHRYDHAGRYVS